MHEGKKKKKKGKAGTTSFATTRKTNSYKPVGKDNYCHRTALLPPVCESLWFVSVYSGPYILMDRHGTDFGLHIPPGL